MRALRQLAVGGALAAAFLAAWSAAPAAQTESPKRWCIAFHEVHPTFAAHHAMQSGVPAGYRIVPPAVPGVGDLLIREEPIVHAGEMADAQAAFDEGMREPVIDFRFNESGARKFGQFTRNNIGRTVAIVVAGQVVSAPVIREPILGGKGRISGNFTRAAAESLAGRIRSGGCFETSQPGPLAPRHGVVIGEK